jgi:RNA polymerase sigma-70 factor (ECF subfamily)
LTAEQAFDDHHKSVYRFVYRFLGRVDLAEDVTQDCFMCLLRDPGRWNAERGDLRTYLFSIARNLALRRYRDDHRSAQVDEDWAVEVPDRQPDQEVSMAVAQAVARLPDLQREALILFEYEGFQLGEIAAIVGADVGVVKSRLHRARQNLKRLLAPYRKAGTYEHVC